MANSETGFQRIFTTAYEWALGKVFDLILAAVLIGVGAIVYVFHVALQDNATSFQFGLVVFGTCTAVVVVALIIYAIRSIVGGSRLRGHQPEQAGGVNPNQLFNVDDFYRTYDNRMMLEAENLIRPVLNQCQSANDRERFLLRLASTLSTILIFERLWLNIYRSQYQALLQLNTRPTMTMAEMRAFYGEAAVRHPEFAERVSFDAWLGFFRNWILVIDQGGLDSVAITIRGGEFLRYVVQSRYDPASRPW